MGRNRERGAMAYRSMFVLITALVFVSAVLFVWDWLIGILTLIVLGPILGIGLWDFMQTKHTIRRNFHVLGHGRYLMEMFRVEIQQYLIRSSIKTYPFEREFRSVVCQRAKGDLKTVPYGLQRGLL